MKSITPLAQTIQTPIEKVISRFRSESSIAAFGNWVDHLIASSEFIEFKEGEIIQNDRELFQRIVVPLTGSLVSHAYTGLPSGETLIETLQLYSFIGLDEVLGQKMSSRLLRAEENSWVMLISRTTILNYFRDAEGNDADLKIFRLLAHSDAVADFTYTLNKKKFSESEIKKILNLISAESVLASADFFSTKIKSLFFISIGELFIKSANTSFSLSAGQWFGASRVGGKNKLDVLNSENCYCYFLDLNQLPQDLLLKLTSAVANEPWFPSIDQIQSEITMQKGLIPGLEYQLHNLNLVEKFNSSWQRLSLQSSRDPRIWPELALTNWSKLVGVGLNIKDLQTQLQLNNRLTPLTVAKFFEKSGHVMRLHKFDAEKMNFEFPCFVFLASRPMILVGSYLNRIFILDSLLGLISISRTDLSANWSGQYLTFEKQEDTMAAQLASLNSNNRAAVAKSFLKECQQRTAVFMRNITGLDFFSVFVALLFPTIMTQFLNDSLKNQDTRYLHLYIIGFLLVVFFESVAAYLSSLFFQWQKSTHIFQINSLFFRQYLLSAIGGVKTNGSNFLSKPNIFLFNLDNETQIAKSLPSQLFLFITLIVLFFIFSPFVASFILVLSALLIASSYWLTLKRLNDVSGVTTIQFELYDRLTEVTTSFSTLKSSGLEEKFRNMTDHTAIGVLEKQLAISSGQNLRRLVMNILNWILSFGGLYLGISEVIKGGFSQGSFFAFSMYLSYFRRPLFVLSDHLATYLLIRGGPQWGLPPSLPSRVLNSANEITTELKGDIAFEKVSFKYNDRAGAVLQDISFNVKPGQVVAIVGRSGSGKTTLARLIAAQLAPSGGRILFDGYESREVSLGTLHEQIAYVPQDMRLFSGTILSNIAFDEDSPDLEHVKKVSKASQAHQFIKKLDNHYFYQLSENGVGLSSGQKHQIGLARALYKNPKILVIDEATANLDPEAEKAVSDGLFTQMAHRSIFIVIHRLYTARRADLILVMKNGRIVESGDHDALMKKNGEYAELYRFQVGLGEQ